MNLLPFLEAVENRRLKRNLKKVEKKISLLEAAAASQVAHVFKQQGESLLLSRISSMSMTLPVLPIKQSLRHIRRSRM